MAKGAQDYEKDYTDPELRERLKEEIKQSDKGGAPGKWSARKSQLLTQEYERHGGDYEHKDRPTEQQQSLKQWTDEEWQTADGSAQARGDDGTDRYLPKKAWEELSSSEQEKTRAKKKDASRKGQGDVANTDEAKQARTDAKLEEMNADDAVKRATSMEPGEAKKALEHEKDTKDRKTVKQKLEKVASQD
ncbi:hypothetical protein WCD74_07350 [Actinomycetospora sp. OC33-EN08]|uniref:DUF5872 domain-containing protein n=1 Tax=Actinomycetospora aurantiaca TaxID=3129233 RepID=A0ABU8MLT7_9PSEU